MTTLTLKELQTRGKALKITGWHKMNKDQLHAAMIESLKIQGESPDIQDFYLRGKQPTICPPAGDGRRVPTKQDQAMKPRRKPAKKVKAPKKPKGETTPRQAPEGMITLAQICEEMGVEGRIARRKLRTSEIKKPGSTWAWDKGHKDVKAVRELLK